MNQLRHFIKRDVKSHNKLGLFKTKREAEFVGYNLGLSAYQHEDGSWDLE